MSQRLLIKWNDATYSTVFVSDEEVIGSVHENDGDWRNEYFDPIFRKLGIKIVSEATPIEQAAIDAWSKTQT